MVNTNKRDKFLSYNSQHCLVKFKNISGFKELSLDAMYKKLNHFYKKFTEFEKFRLAKKFNEGLKARVLDSAEDFLNDLHYIYQERYNEEKNGLNT